MAGFKFKLARVKQFKSTQEDRRKDDLRRCQADKVREQDTLAALVASRDELRAAAGREAGESVSAARLAEYRNYARVMQERIIAQNEVVARCAAAVNAAREALLQARMEHQILTKLAERKQADWQTEDNRREQQQLDEIAGIKAARAGSTIRREGERHGHQTG